MNKIIATISTTLLTLCLLSGCSTINGAGKDIQGAGQVISNEAQKAKN